MKKSLISLTLFLFILKSFGQPQTSPAISKDYYLQKSKNQKNAARILLGTGLIIAATGGIVQLIHEGARGNSFDLDFTGAWIAIGGGVVALSSIPLFISSAANKRKAASIVIRNQNILLPQKNSFILMPQPAVTLKIGL